MYSKVIQLYMCVYINTYILFFNSFLYWWRRMWQSTPVFLPGESHGQRSLAGYTPRGCKELDMTEVTQHTCIFSVGVQPMNNVVIASGEQQRDSAIHMQVSILPQTHLPSRLPCNIEQSSMSYTAGPCWLSTLNIAVCTCPSQTP